MLTGILQVAGCWQVAGRLLAGYWQVVVDSAYLVVD